MQARMKNPVLVLPDALQAMLALGKAVESDDVGVSYVTHKMIQLRASQINGCGVCVHMHARELREAGESDERIHSVAAWKETPFYTDEERAALALTEAVTRLADQSNPVPDDVWQEFARYYDHNARAAIILSIGMINLWNRLSVTVRQIAGPTG